MLSIILEKYRNISINKLLNDKDISNEFSLWKLDNLLMKYSEKLNLIKNQNEKNKLIFKLLLKNLNEIKVEEDKYDSYIPGKYNNRIT